MIMLSNVVNVPNQAYGVCRYCSAQFVVAANDVGDDCGRCALSLEQAREYRDQAADEIYVEATRRMAAAGR